VQYLKRARELPSLKGRNVYFVGLGWTASPQPALSISSRNAVVQIWEQIARAAGARCVGGDEAANTRGAVPNRPPVAIVPLPSPPPALKPCTTISLGDNNHVGFEFNSTTFRDPAGARTTLGKLAHLMLRTGESVTLIGSTSSEGGNKYNNALSLRRANAVKAVLTQFHVPASRITTIGDGSHMPGRLDDRGPNGQLLIGPAIQDRRVVAKLSGSACRSS
jgi:outer membrane protein OmpA-like peptidoglycan-associated protein